MRKTNRKDRSKQSRNDVVGKLLELDDLKKVTGGGNHEGRPQCKAVQCEVCVGNRRGNGKSG